MPRTSVNPVVTVTAGSLLQMVLQLAVQTLIARQFGMSSAVDAYEAAISLPLVIAAILGLPIGSVLIPAVNRAQRKGGDEAAWSTASSIGSIMLLGTLAIAGLLTALAQPLAGWLFSGLGATETALAARLMMLLAWLIPANVMTAFCQATHNWQGRFAVSALAGVVGPGVMFAMVAIQGRSLTIETLAIAVVMGGVANVLIQAPSLLRHLRWMPKFRLMSPTFLLFLPLLLGGIYTRIDPVVDRSLGSAFDEGTLACMGNSNRVINAAVAIAVGGLSVVAFPRMARAAQLGTGHLAREIAEALRALVTILVPLSAALWFFGGDLIHDLFERGRFTAADTERVAYFVRCALGVVVGGALGEITSRAFYATHDMKTPTAIGIACFTVALALKFLLSRSFGAGGILAASSIGLCASAVVQIAVLARRLGGGILTGVVARLAFSSAAAGAASLTGAGLLKWELPWSSVWGGIAGLFVYTALMYAVIRYQRIAAAPLVETDSPTAEELSEEQAGLNRP